MRSWKLWKRGPRDPDPWYALMCNVIECARAPLLEPGLGTCADSWHCIYELNVGTGFQQAAL